MGSSNENSYFGPVQNPWDLKAVPGGSSGGSAAAVAARLAPAATGTDTGGSIRQPASFSGITGIKPTYGRVSRYGMIAFASSLDQGGPMAQSAADCATLLNAMAGFDERDSTSLVRDDEDYTRYLGKPWTGDGAGKPLAGLRIGLPKEYFGAGLADDVRASIDAALKQYEALGATLVEVSLPKTELSIPVYYVIAPAEASSNLSRFDGVRYGHRAAEYRDLLDMYKKSRAEGFGPEVKRRILVGAYVLSHGYYDAYYLQAQKIRRIIAQDFQEAFKQCDVIMGPVAPTVAWNLGEKGDDPVQMYLADIYTLSVSLAGLPGMSVPCGFGAGANAQRPVGLQIIGNYFNEARMLQVADAFQRATDWHRQSTGRSVSTMAKQWEVVIGLETHAQLSTASKIFSGAATQFGAAPNTQACPVDLALPGTLPVMNRGAVERAIQFGLAIGATIAPRSIFARKNYFYPDLPKGYQISQYEIPVVQGGQVTIQVPANEKAGKEAYEKIVNLTRAHLEEDAGKSLHEDFAGMTGIDLNRAGTPLLEIVTEPEMRSAAEAVAYAKTLHTLVTWLGICDGNMQEGSFRCDANVSVRPVGQAEFGTRAEIKNLNSFRFLEEAIQYEVRRQIELIEDGGTVVQETRLYDPDKRETRSMRSKEDAHDYRYFPDPDLMPLVIDAAWVERVKSEMPELPVAMQQRFVSQYGLTPYDANVLTSSKAMAAYYEAVVRKVGAGQRQGRGQLADGRSVVATESRRSRHRRERRCRPRNSRCCCSASPTARSPTRSPRKFSSRSGKRRPPTKPPPIASSKRRG